MTWVERSTRLRGESLDAIGSIRRVARTQEALAVDLAYSAFFRKEFVRVTRVVDLIVRDSGAAEDIAQEAFTELLLRWDRISTYELPEGWVRRVAIRRAVRWVRRERLRSLLLPWIDAPRPPASSIDPDLETAIRSLSPQQRAAVVLHYLEGRPLPEVASLIGCSHATAKVHVFKARRRLADLLTDPEGDTVHGS